MSSVDNLDLLGKKTCRIIVHRARNLKPKGKDSKNNAFVTICVGKEKFATSVVEKSQNPEWNEDCQLGVRPHDTKVELTVLHQDFFLERFLGKVEIPLNDVEASARKSLKRWYRLMGKHIKGKKDEKNRGDLEVTIEIKGYDAKVVDSMHNPHAHRAQMDAPESSPLRKATSTPYIANQSYSYTSNPFDEPDGRAEDIPESSSPAEIPVSRIHSHNLSPTAMLPSHSQSFTSSHRNTPQRNSSLRNTSSVNASPRFQRHGMGRRIIRTSFRREKEREEFHASTPNLSKPAKEENTPEPVSPTSISPTSPTETTPTSRITSITNFATLPSHLGKLRRKSKSMAIPVEDFSSLTPGEDDVDGEPGMIKRAASEECLSKSQEDMVDGRGQNPSPTPEPPKRRQYKPAVKSARRAKAVSQYFEASTDKAALSHHENNSSVSSTKTYKLSGARAYENMTKEELIQRLVEQEKQIKEQNKMLGEMEGYIDDLLLKVIISAPGLLDQGFQPKPTMRPKSPVQRYQAKKQEFIL